MDLWLLIQLRLAVSNETLVLSPKREYPTMYELYVCTVAYTYTCTCITEYDSDFVPLFHKNSI